MYKLFEKHVLTDILEYGVTKNVKSTNTVVLFPKNNTGSPWCLNKNVIL